MGQSYFCIIKLCSCFFDFFLSPPPCCKTFTRVDNMLVLLHIFFSSKSKLYGYNADVSKICGIWSYVKHHLNLPELVLSAQDSCHDRSYIRSWTFCSLLTHVCKGPEKALPNSSLELCVICKWCLISFVTCVIVICTRKLIASPNFLFGGGCMLIEDFVTSI